MLVIKDLVPTDTGKYTCNVSNIYGWINHSYTVDVHGKIYKIEENSYSDHRYPHGPQAVHC